LLLGVFIRQLVLLNGVHLPRKKTLRRGVHVPGAAFFDL
jgi:hypothetical protein